MKVFLTLISRTVRGSTPQQRETSSQEFSRTELLWEMEN
jgi:hypothetical protein